MPFLNVISGCPPMECGLIFLVHEQPVPVPLKGVSIRTKIVDFVAEVTVEQRYVNQESGPIEAVYMFPIEEEAAVVDFKAEIENRVIKTEVKKKEEARAAYDKAMQDHNTAVLLEETTPDVFRIKLGQLKPGEGAKITLVYISELPVEGNAIRLTIPTTIAPRYVPPTDDSEAAKVIGAIKYSLDSPAPLTFNMEVLSQSKITCIKSPSHVLDTELSAAVNEQGQFSAKSKLSGQTTDLNKDLVVLIESSDPHKPTVFLEKSEDPLIAGMVSLVPSFKLKEQKTEMIFLVDRSGSMGPGYSYGNEEQQGGSIASAKKALGLFLHSLPSDCYFNIFSFGSHFDSLFTGSVKYDDDSLVKAKQHVQGMHANYGGTEIYQPLEAIFKEPIQEGHLRQIFVLTDGEVSNSMNVVDLVKRNSTQGRVFALGLGASASRHLVKGIARAGGGSAVFAAEGEDLRPKVMTQLKNAMQPSISEIKVEWDGLKDENVANAADVELETKKTLLGFMMPKKSSTKPNKKVLTIEGQAPIRIPPIYDGTRLLVYRIFSSTEQELPKKVTITAETPDGPLSVVLPIEKSCFLQGNFVHQLAARKRIQDLEETILENEEDGTKEEIETAVVDLAIKYRLASKHTSFVGVDDKAAKGEFELAMNTRDIRNQVPSGFGAPMIMACSMPMMPQSMSFGMMGGPPPPAPMAAGFAGRDGGRPALGFAAPMTKKSRARAKMGGGPVSQLNDVTFESCDAVAQVMEVHCDDEAEDDEVGFASQDFGTVKGGSSLDSFKEQMPAPAEDKLTSLIDLQSSDGHFRWGEILIVCTKQNIDELTAKRPSLAANDDIWWTAIAVALLEAMVNDQDLWELVVQKARKFLAKHLSLEDVGKLIEVAKNI